MTDPFVRLMRTYCIDYTNSHDLSVCDSIMDDGYVVQITGMTLPRDTAYKPSVEQVFERFPNLGLAVHEFATNGDRLVMRFSEHAADAEGRLACWAGIGLYDWNGSRLTSCRVEQDFWSQQRQLESGRPDPLEAPHLDPWSMTVAAPADPDTEKVAREWLLTGSFGSLPSGRVDAGPPSAHTDVVQAGGVEVLDLFSAGDRVAFHASLHGSYAGGLSPDVDGRIGDPARLDVAGLVRVAGGAVAGGHVVTDRFGTWLRLVSGQ
jgi:hypothetical protein